MCASMKEWKSRERMLLTKLKGSMLRWVALKSKISDLIIISDERFLQAFPYEFFVSWQKHSVLLRFLRECHVQFFNLCIIKHTHICTHTCMCVYVHTFRKYSSACTISEFTHRFCINVKENQSLLFLISWKYFQGIIVINKLTQFWHDTFIIFAALLKPYRLERGTAH